MCARVCVCVYGCVKVCMCVYGCLCMHVCVDVCLYASMPACTHVCMYERMHVCMVHGYMRVWMSLYACMCGCIHVCMPLCNDPCPCMPLCPNTSRSLCPLPVHWVYVSLYLRTHTHTAMSACMPAFRHAGLDARLAVCMPA